MWRFSWIAAYLVVAVSRAVALYAAEQQERDQEPEDEPEPSWFIPAGGGCYAEAD